MKATIILNENTTFQDAVKSLDQYGFGFLSCVGESGKLLGILTDGDVRRAILNGKTELKDIINTNPEVMSIDSNKNEVVARLKKLHRRHMPLIDKDHILKSVFFLDDLEFNSRDNHVVLMAGGLGSRLGSLTKETPKPMLKIAGKPIIQHIIELFRDQGFGKFIVCVNYKKEIIESYLGDGKKFGVNIDYVYENKRMGTAGALTLIEQDMSDSFFVVNADVITSMDFESLLQFHESNESLATMCVKKYQHEVPYGVVNVSNKQLVSIEEKPKLNFFINAGIYLLSRETLKYIPKLEFFDMPELFKSLKKNEFDVFTYENENYWIDIGEREQLLKANLDMEIG